MSKKNKTLKTLKSKRKNYRTAGPVNLGDPRKATPPDERLVIPRSATPTSRKGEIDLGDPRKATPPDERLVIPGNVYKNQRIEGEPDLGNPRRSNEGSLSTIGNIGVGEDGGIPGTVPTFPTSVPTPTPTPVSTRSIGGGSTVTQKGISSDAPVGITQTAPKADLQQMTATSLDVESGLTPSTSIQQIDKGSEATANTVVAERMTAVQGKATEAATAGTPSYANQWADAYVAQYPEWSESQKSQARDWAVKSISGQQVYLPSWLAGDDFLKGIDGLKGFEADTTSRDAETFEATTTQGQMGTTQAAQGQVTQTSGAGQAQASTASGAQRDTGAEQGALAQAATRPEEQDYADGVTTDERFKVSEVSGPDVEGRTAQTISQEEMNSLSALAQERGVDINDLPEYQLAQQRVAQQATAATASYASRLGEAPEETAARAQVYGADFTPQGGQTEIDNIPAFNKAAKRTAQVAEASTRIANELGTAPSVDLQGREAITGTAPQGDAAQIGGIPTMRAAQMQAVTGKARTVAAADMMAVVADIPEDIAAAISQDPATVQAQLDTGADPQVTAAVAALPEEALVSTQMESLLAGMEEGKTPAWALPAVSAIESQLARRGLQASSVGRDALFNAIIQSALPMAQSNSQALQARAQQNLSNEQQANLASAQNTMQVRMQNLANRQTAASQTAQMAQEIKVQQGSFDQQAAMLSAQQQQETRLTNAQMAQQRAQQESAQRQQAAIANLNAASQMDLANLQALNAAATNNLNADQQSRLQTYNAQVNKIMRQADLTQDMTKANLSQSLQIEMQRVSEMNAAAKDTMTAEQTERLTNLQTFIDFRKTNASMAQQMDMANMSNEQQIELVNLQEKSATDAANFSADNQFRLQELTSVVARATRQAELNSRMEEVNLDSSLKVELSELSEKNTTARANMTSEQQSRLANLNVLVDFRKTNAGMAQQMDMVNLANAQQVELANLQERSNVDASNFTESNRFRMQELNNYVQVMSQNEQLLQNSDMAKLSMQEKINLANLTFQNQADSESMTAENTAELQVYEKRMQAGQINAQLAQQMGLSNLSNKQSAAMFNAQINANLDMRQFDVNQQVALANSQFLQTMTATKFNADQQTAIQNATMLTQVDLANADARTRVSVENAKNFLAMDMSNLSNRQQGIVMDQQIAQQALLSDQAAQNAAKQFGATSQNQIDQFMISQANAMNQFNASAKNAMESFNVTEANRMAAIEAGNILQADSLSAQLEADIDKFNVSIDSQREQWNAANAQAVEQSNINWRRQANTIDTAAANAANQMNVQNAYNISALDQTQLWQQLRDEAAYIRQAYENNEQREATLIATAIGNETASTKDNTTSTNSLISIIKSFGYQGG
jgi:hypothetical protein